MASTAIPSDGGPLVFVGDLDQPVLAADDRHHLSRVRRLRNGDALILGDGAGRWRRARFLDDTPEPEAEVVSSERLRPTLTVAFALVKGAKPELAVQKLTELGIDQIVAFTAERSVVRWDAGKAEAARGRLAKVARGAAMQSRQAWLPLVEPIARFADVAARDGAVMADRGGQAPSLERPCILVGPEGGWSDDELAGGPTTVSLSTGVLRAETAAIVAGSLLAALRAGVVSPS